MFARFGLVDMDPASLDKAVVAYETGIVPQVVAVDGFRGTFAGVDRASGRFMVVTLWRDLDAMTAHEEANARRFIAQAVEASGSPAPTVDRYEIVLWNVEGHES